MDLPYYYFDSAITPSPIERRIEEFNVGRVLTVPSSSSSERVVFLADVSQSSVVGAVKIELRFDDDRFTAVPHLQGDPEEALTHFSNARVEPITAKMIALVKWKVEAVTLLDSVAAEDEYASRVALRGVIDDVEDFIRAGDYWSLNQLLSQVQPAMLRKITSVAYLRTSFRVRSKLSSWGALYEKVYAYLDATGQEPGRALRGLNRPKVSGIV